MYTEKNFKFPEKNPRKILEKFWRKSGTVSGNSGKKNQRRTRK